LLLECAGVALRYERGDVPLSPELETVFALTLREAVTNIQRHARARHAQVTLAVDGGEAVLLVVDDGRGGNVVPGNGLLGMRERIESLGGRLRIDTGAGRQAGAQVPGRPWMAESGRGTRLEARLPLPAADRVSARVVAAH